MGEKSSKKNFGDSAWVDHWQKVGPRLDKIRRKELRNFDYQANLEAIDALLEIGCRNIQPRTTSGLVELQRLLAKAKQ